MKILFSIPGLIADVTRAVARAQRSIFTVAGTYLMSILIGMVMVHTGNTFALTYRDQLVNRAVQQNPAVAARQGITFGRLCGIFLEI